VAAPNTQRQNSRSTSGWREAHDEPSDGSGDHHGGAHLERAAKLHLHEGPGVGEKTVERASIFRKWTWLGEDDAASGTSQPGQSAADLADRRENTASAKGHSVAGESISLFPIDRLPEELRHIEHGAVRSQPGLPSPLTCCFRLIKKEFAAAQEYRKFNGSADRRIKMIRRRHIAFKPGEHRIHAGLAFRIIKHREEITALDMPAPHHGFVRQILCVCDYRQEANFLSSDCVRQDYRRNEK
jgi:hypothetical protein